MMVHHIATRDSSLGSRLATIYSRLGCRLAIGDSQLGSRLATRDSRSHGRPEIHSNRRLAVRDSQSVDSLVDQSTMCWKT
jgi:hypothetical protein